MNPRPPLPPFTEETARQKVQAAEDAWNSRDPERVALAYTEDTEWRNRSEFINGRARVVEFLRRKFRVEIESFHSSAAQISTLATAIAGLRSISIRPMSVSPQPMVAKSSRPRTKVCLSVRQTRLTRIYPKTRTKAKEAKNKIEAI